MPPISPSQLQEYARKPDLELRQVTEGGKQKIDTNKGSFFGRMVRNIKVGNEDAPIKRATKRDEYLGAKTEVYNTLKSIYGTKIAEQAWRANIGRMEGQTHKTSSDHPITGRHIQNMFKTANGLVTKSAQPKWINKDGLRNNSGSAITDKATAAWMLRTNPNYERMALRPRMHQMEEMPNQKFQIGETSIDLRAKHIVRSKHDSTIEKAVELNQSLTKDIDAFFKDAKPSQRDGFWTLELLLPNDFHGRDKHVIGIQARAGDNVIRVFDANNREITIPPEEFGGWLNQHIQRTYGGDVKHIDLYRAEQTLVTNKDLFVNNKGKWDCHTELTGKETKEKFDNNAKELLGDVVKRNPQDGMYPQFWKDVDRSFEMHVLEAETDDPPLQLTRNNVDEQMQALVTKGDDNEAGDANAKKSLSSLVNQTLGNALHQTAREQLTGESEILEWEGSPGRDPETVSIWRGKGEDENMVYVQYTNKKHLTQFMNENGVHQLSPETDYIDSGVTIAVSIDELRKAGQEGRVPEFTYAVEPWARMHVEGFEGKKTDWEITPDPNARDLGTVYNALLTGPNRPRLVGTQDWQDFVGQMKDRVKTEPLIRFSEGGLQTTHHFLDTAPKLSLRIDGQPQDTSRPEVAQEKLLKATNGDRQQAEQLTKLLDRYIIDDICKLGASSIGATPEQIKNSLKTGEYEVEIFQREGKGIPDTDGYEEPYLEVKLSQRVNPSAFLPGPEGDEYPRVNISTTLKVKLSDLTAGTPENFEVIEPPKLELSRQPRTVPNPQIETTAWMLQQDVRYQDGNTQQRIKQVEGQRDQYRIDDLVVDLRAQPVRRFENQGPLSYQNRAGIPVALIESVDNFFNTTEERVGNWTLDIQLPGAFRGREQHTLGIRAIRDSDLVVISDPNGLQFTVHRNELEQRLAEHLQFYGDINSVDIYRVEQRLFDSKLFVRDGDTWSVDSVSGDPESYRQELTATVNEKTVDKEPVNGLYPQFWRDVDAQVIVVGDEGLRLTSGNSVQQLTGLVSLDGDQNEEGDRNAIKALSGVLNQNLGTSMPHVRLNGGEAFRPVGSGRRDLRTYEVVREGDDVIVRFSDKKHLTRFLGNGAMHRLSPQTDTEDTSVSIRISIQELRTAGQENRAPQFEFVTPPTLKFHVEGYQGEPRGWSERPMEGARRFQSVDEVFQFEGNLIGDDRWNRIEQGIKERVGNEQQLIRLTPGGQQIARNYVELFPMTEFGQTSGKLSLSINNAPQPINWQQFDQAPQTLVGAVGGDGVGPDQTANRVAQLSKLLDRSIIDDLTHETALSLGGKPFDLHTREQYEVDLRRVDNDGEPYIEIKLSQGLRLDRLVPGQDLPPPTVMTTTLRVKLSDLDDGHPENFTVVQRPKIEIGNAPPPPLRSFDGLFVADR